MIIPSQSFPRALRRAAKSAILAALAAIPAIPAPAAAPIVYGPDADAATYVQGAIRANLFGAVDVTSRSLELAVTVNGQRVRSGEVYLAEPAEPVMLGVEVNWPADQQVAKGSEGFGDTGFYRQSSLKEVVWLAGDADLLLPAADGQVRWKPAAGAAGVTTPVTANVAMLQVERTATQAASPDARANALLHSGRATVLMLSGVPFDRNGDGILLGRNVGIYPNERGNDAPQSILENAALYAPPSTFYRIDAATGQLMISQHQRLRDLLPPVFAGESETGDRMVALSPRLIRFLRAYERKLAESKLSGEHLAVLRGFVSPTERLRLERQGIRLARFTRFQYGDALALVYDPKVNAKTRGEFPPIMGDANGDGQTNLEDVRLLAELARQTMSDLGMWGGVGVVKKYEGPGASKDTPYLHIDLRGWYVPFEE